MRPIEFLRSEPGQALLARAARCAETPLSVHYFEEDRESPRVMGWGSCRICLHVAVLPGGRKACWQSRAPASAAALRRNSSIPFLCHMGFAGVAVPAISGEHFVLTFGPYCPSEGAPGLESDALAGLAALCDAPIETLPVSLDDIHRATPNALSSLAQWTQEALAEQWNRLSASSESAETDTAAPDAAPPRRGSRPTAVEDYAASAMAAALAAGDQPQARRILQGVMAEGRTRPRARIGVRRARLIAAVAASLEAIERGGWGESEIWDAFPAFVTEAVAASGDKALLDAGMRLLGRVKRRVVRQTAEKTPRGTPRGAKPAYAALNAIVLERLSEGITLEQAAALLGEKATTISHRLRRKLGMSFSEYVAQLRIEKAKESLRRTKLTATEVARRVGFSDQSNFGKTFRHLVGMSPLEYRRRFGRRG